ncbi:peptidoglycan-binding protein [Erwinia mallotivora]|uniref:peptidoglycan-binding domain-containing protein n=1 Tax=Erwinia mallotivora TaxID=69222 RepID=UPI0035E930B9
MKGHTVAAGAIYPEHLSSSVGACGSNAPADVKKLQQMISDAGYPLSTGRRLIVDGRCGQGTIEAIRWYQRLLTLSPSGLVMPVDTFFMPAVSRALSPHWRPRNTILHVHEGQITFDAEGVDCLPAVARPTIPFFRACCTARRGVIRASRSVGVTTWEEGVEVRFMPRSCRRESRSTKR